MVGAVVVDEIRWIGREQDRLLAVHDADDVIGLGAVAAQQPVIAEQPQIARARHRVQRRLGDDVFAGKAVALVERRQQPVQVLALEAGEIEIEAGGVQRVQLGGEQLVIPARQLGQAVIRDPVRADLLRRQVRQPDDRHLAQAQVLRRQQAAMAGDDLAVVRHHHRRRPAVLDQRGGDLGHLILGVGARVLRVRLQARERPLLDLLGQETQRRHGDCACPKKSPRRAARSAAGRKPRRLERLDPAEATGIQR